MADVEFAPRVEQLGVSALAGKSADGKRGHEVPRRGRKDAAQMRAALLELCSKQPERIVVDLAGVDFVDSTALGVLVEARTTLEDRQTFLLASPKRDTHRALTISGLDQHMSVHDTVESALAAPLGS